MSLSNEESDAARQRAKEKTEAAAIAMMRELGMPAEEVAQLLADARRVGRAAALPGERP